MHPLFEGMFLGLTLALFLVSGPRSFLPWYKPVFIAVFPKDLFLPSAFFSTI